MASRGPRHDFIDLASQSPRRAQLPDLLGVAHRPLLAGDTVALRLAALQDSPASFGSAYEDEEPRSAADWVDVLTGSDDRVFFGAFSYRELIGSVGTQRESGRKERHRAFLRGRHVTPPRRGQGVGRQLLALAMAHAASWPGLEQVTLDVTSGNAAAVALYRSAGFFEYGVTPRVLRLGETYHDEILMVRHLRPA